MDSFNGTTDPTMLPHYLQPSLSSFSLSPSSSSPSSSPGLSVSHQVGISILTIALVVGFPGNLFVVWSVLCRVRQRSVTCLLVFNLALADVLVLLTAPLFLRSLTVGVQGWEFGTATCKIVHYLCAVNMYTSIYLITLMSADRWLATSRPFVAQRLRTKRALLSIILAFWVLAFVLALPMPFYRSNEQIFGHKNITSFFCVPYHWDSVGHQVFQYLVETFMGFLLPFSLIAGCYASVFCRLRTAMFKRRGRGSCLILTILAAFALFWLPYHIVNILQVIGLLTDTEWAIDAAKVARPNVTAFAFLSSSVNPVLYVFAGSSHIRNAGLGFMAKLFEGTYSDTQSRSTRSTRSSVPDDNSIFRKITQKMSVRGGGGGGGGRGESVAGGEEDTRKTAELKNLMTVAE
ncbi:leukotriene B4 receptor 1-like [Clupea harengus]|uniref:Leukotriene B4 receptor 1-like n=1 Tax=Clupea harengus TaxID=7950 RepID=A0A6P8GZ92_CLUHA|nr:leukotriene B4 receptor 1-like [Clupea harengus]XP_031440777.1 leukotriene B4 receptor 1-like [Clupea harengus]XP_031440778.1 leukotriene B4 receptor 1-like [Clupea harengus]